MTEKFGMGAMGLGPLPGMVETMDFVKRAWSSFSLPSSMTPTLDVDEIDKRIADLKTVEQWLSLNLNMLQSAIQGLEIQRGTLAALKVFGEAVGTPGGLDAGAAMAKAMAAMAATVPAQAAGGPGAGDARSEPRDQGAQAADRRPEAAGDTGASSGASAGMPFTGGGAAAINPAAWWDLLQSQFSQVAQAALAGASGGLGGAGASAAAREAPEARARPSARPSPARTAKQPRKPAARKAGARARKPAG